MNVQDGCLFKVDRWLDQYIEWVDCLKMDG